MQGWEQFFAFNEQIYWDLTLKVMSSFELDQMITSLSPLETISFQMFGAEYLMSYMDFSMVMGLINVEYTGTKSYS